MTPLIHNTFNLKLMYKLNIFNRISLGLAIALVLTSGFVPNIQAEESNPFTDLSVSDENYEAIVYLEDNGVIGGYPDGTFKPDDTVNRAELLKILVGGTGVTPTVETYSDCFPDVTTDWYAPYVCYAKSEGWVDGYPDGTFKPEDEVNKVEAIKMLVNSQGYSVSGGVSEPPFDDVATTDWFAPYVEVAKDKGLLEETGGSFGVADEMKRGGVSENIYRAMIIEDYGLTSFSSYSLTLTTVGEDDPVSTPSRIWTVNEIEIVDDPYQLYTDVETDKLVGINFTNQNISDETLSFSDVSFVIKATDGSEYAPVLVSPKTPELTGGTLDPDEKRTGWVTFEVPAELTEADLVFLVTLEGGDVERIKKPITIPAVDPVAVEEDVVYEQTDIVEFDDFEWEILNVYRVDQVGSESNPQYPQNEYFLLIEAELKNTSDEAKYNGDPILIVGDEQFDHSITAEVYGQYFFDYSTKQSQFEAGTRSTTFFGFDVPEIEGEELTLILKSWSVNDDRAKISITDIQEE